MYASFVRHFLFFCCAYSLKNFYIMNYRLLGKTGFNVSEISLGTWQIGGDWSHKLSFDDGKKLVHEAIDKGINFIDTADVYGMGLSEKAVGEVVNSRKEEVYVATKCGRKIHPHIDVNYKPEVLRKYVEDSLRNMRIESLDLIQLHCPPREVYYMPEVFELFDRLKSEGKIKNMGVSVEKVEEAIKAIDYDNVTTVQIIFNMFRQRPADLFFELAKKKNIGVIVRVPLASGLLTGKYSAATSFNKDDHRFFNRNGEAFDKGETFSGVDYQTGLEAVGKLKGLFPDHDNLAPIALKWILHFDAVSCIIPGASSSSQLQSNLSAVALPALTPEQLAGVQEIYDSMIKNPVHYLW